MGKINYSEYLDIKFFQILQDRLAQEFGIGSIITDIEGNPLTRPSNFSDFCINHIRGKEKGLKRCMNCDAYGGQQAKKLKKPIIYKCHAGLIDFASPIIIDDKIVGCFLCGQILTEKFDEERFKTILKELEIDEKSSLEALKKVRIIPYERVEYIANFLYELSSKLSNFSNYQKTVLTTSENCYKSIEKFDRFVDRIKNRENSSHKSKFVYFFHRIYETIFKKFLIDEEKLYEIDKNIRIFSQETDKISEKIKVTQKYYGNFDINSVNCSPFKK